MQYEEAMKLFWQTVQLTSGSDFKIDMTYCMRTYVDTFDWWIANFAVSLNNCSWFCSRGNDGNNIRINMLILEQPEPLP